MSRINGIAIEDYKDLTVRETGLAVPRDPTYKYAVSNGIRPDDFIVDANLVLYMPLFALKGGKFKSVDAYGHTCTATTPTWGTQGRTFNGTTDTLPVTHHASQLLTTGGTIEAWIKPDSLGGGSLGRIVDKTYATGYIFMVYTGNRLRLGLVNGTGLPFIYSAVDSVIVGDGNWYHAVATWDNTGYTTIYVNGSKSGTQGVSADPSGINNTDDLTIGNVSGGTNRGFDGIIGEVKVYNRALSVVEVAHNYNATKWRY